MAMASTTKVKYEPMIPQAPLDMKFHYYKEDGTLGIKADCTLISSIDELKEFAKKCKGATIAVDTETTGLTFYSDFIVGFSISLDAYSGIYVPIRHQIKRVDKIKRDKRDPETGEILYTKAGKPRQETIKEETIFPCDKNLPDREALDILYDIMINAKVSLLHNYDFDLNMIKSEGYNITKVSVFDTILLPYIYDPEGRGVCGLKYCTRRALGRHVPEFKDVLGKEDNFRYVDPELGYEYACMDSMNTMGVFQKLYPLVRNLLAKAPRVLTLDGKKYDIVNKDNQLIKAFVDYYDHAELWVDKEVAIQYREQIVEGAKELAEKIFTYFGTGPFSLSPSSNEFKRKMEEKQIITGALTDTGAISYGKNGIKEFKKNLTMLKAIINNPEVIKFERSKLDKRSNKNGLILSKILNTYGHPYFTFEESTNLFKIMALNGDRLEKDELFYTLNDMYEKEKVKLEVLVNIQKNSSLSKAMNSYVDKLTKVDKCRMKYKLQATSSCRLASGNGSKSDKKKNNYYIDLNAQNLTKPHSCFYEATPCEDSADSILGWKFTQVTDEYAHKYKEEKIIVEGSSPKGNIRNCFIAPKEQYYESAITKEYADKYGFTESTGVKKVFKVTLSDGSIIKCTEDTVFRVLDDCGKEILRPLREVKKNDTIISSEIY